MDYHSLYPHFYLGVAMRYAQDSNTPKMLQIIFYAMVIDDVTELDISHRLTMDFMIWAMQKLNWGPVEAWLGDNDRRLRRAQASCLANPPASPVLAGDPSRGKTTSLPTFRDTAQAAEYVRDNLCWPVREFSSLHPNLLSLLP